MGDITIGICVQTVFTLSGIALLIGTTGRIGITGPAVAGALLAILAVGGFYAVQRFGIFRILGMLVKRFANDPNWSAVLEKGDGIDENIRTVYKSRRSIATCFFATSVSWFSSSVEVWIALRAVGVEAPFTYAVILESICQGVRAAMFFIPGGLGVQEGGYVVVGGLLGIPGDTALAVSLIRRARELALGVPGLLAWQFTEGRRLLRGRLTAMPGQSIPS
jgi:putative membrane protein